MKLRRLDVTHVHLNAILDYLEECILLLFISKSIAIHSLAVLMRNKIPTEVISDTCNQVEFKSNIPKHALSLSPSYNIIP